MARTRTQIRQLTVQQLGLPFVSGTADSTGGSTTTLADTPDLQQFKDDTLIGSWVYISDGSPTFRDLQIDDSVQSTGVVRFIPALGAAPNDRAYEILPFSATAIHQSIDSALTQLFDIGILVREFNLRNIVSGSPMFNASFDLWATTVTLEGWSSAGAGVTQSRERTSANIALSENAVGLISNSGSEGRLELGVEWRRFLLDMRGHTIRFYAWVRSSTASHARIALGNGSTFTYSGYHGGGGGWRLLRAEYNSALGDTDVVPSLVVANNTATSYFADCWIEGRGPVEEYPWLIALAPDGPSFINVAPVGIDIANTTGTLRQLGPQRELSGWSFVRHHEISYPHATSVQRGLLTIPALGSGYRLNSHCVGPFTLPDSDTENVEVTLPESLLVAKMAAKVLLERRMLAIPLAARRLYADIVAKLQADIISLSSGHGQSSRIGHFGPRI